MKDLGKQLLLEAQDIQVLMSIYGVVVPILKLREHWAEPLNELHLLREGVSTCEEKVGCLTRQSRGESPIFVKATKNVNNPITVRVAIEGMEPPFLPGNKQIGVVLPDINLQGPWRKNHLPENLLSLLHNRFHSCPNRI
jgi:hypothetical protein